MIDTALQTHEALIELSTTSQPLPASCGQDTALQTDGGALVELSTASSSLPVSPGHVAALKNNGEVLIKLASTSPSPTSSGQDTALQTNGALIELSTAPPPLPSSSKDMMLKTNGRASLPPASSSQGQNTQMAVQIKTLIFFYWFLSPYQAS